MVCSSTYSMSMSAPWLIREMASLIFLLQQAYCSGQLPSSSLSSTRQKNSYCHTKEVVRPIIHCSPLLRGSKFIALQWNPQMQTILDLKCPDQRCVLDHFYCKVSDCTISGCPHLGVPHCIDTNSYSGCKSLLQGGGYRGVNYTPIFKYCTSKSQVQCIANNISLLTNLIKKRNIT